MFRQLPTLIILWRKLALTIGVANQPRKKELPNGFKPPLYTRYFFSV
ncbi:MAG: hypothetical protein H7334_05990 [Ferruginibacter sp.]|nr:hypothetical protein [Ferruginibacter sp.]